METEKNNSACFVEVAVPLPVFTTFTYTLPESLTGAVSIGMRVLVPFGRRLLTGYVAGFAEKPPGQKLKQIIDIFDDGPLFSGGDLEFYRWAATYYHYPPGQAIKTALPSGINVEYGGAAALTEAGKRLLAESTGDIPGRHLLQALQDGGRLTFKALGKKTGKQGLLHNIRLLAGKGLIEVSLIKKAGAVGVRRQKWFSAVSAAGGAAVKGRQKEVYDYIERRGSVSAALLKDHFGSCAGQIRALEKKGLLASEEQEVFRRPPEAEEIFREPVHTPSARQKEIIELAGEAVKKHQFYPMLLHGVTGSGKTEVYLHIMQQALSAGRQCLYLVPEIALTAQLYDRVRSRLSVPMAMLHSGLSDAERFDAWRLIRRGEVQVVLGARSAVFASFKRLGVIVVDEEHDPSYKQDDGLRYNARDMALVKGKIAGCTVIMGSATPSLESYQNAVQKKYALASLPERVENRPLPPVAIVDMRAEQAFRKKKSAVMSKPLEAAIARRLEAGKQSLLFLNRRGFSPAFLCEQCGHTFTCPNCAVSLIHHRMRQKLCCHYCDFAVPVPGECPSCGSYFLAPLGWGTERLEAEIKHLFPRARVARMDRDTTAGRGALRAILQGMHRRDIDILIGTQMIVKGYHLPDVTLVGVICADQSLNLPDYRAGERTFQLLTQVAGRSGRGDDSGEVIIQTYNPDHYSIQCARTHDYNTFFTMEMAFRRELGYPPYRRLINIRLDGTNEKRVEACSRAIGDNARKLLQKALPGDAPEILGPARAPWEKIKGRYRYHMLLKGSSAHRLRLFAQKVLEQTDGVIKKSGVKVVLDIDPLLLM